MVWEFTRCSPRPLKLFRGKIRYIGAYRHFYAIVALKAGFIILDKDDQGIFVEYCGG